MMPQTNSHSIYLLLCGQSEVKAMQITNKEIQRLRSKYACIVRWSRSLGSYDYYIDNQVLEADADNAPDDVIYKDHNNIWHRAGDIKNEQTRKEILGQ